jgi:hypothetical protein
MNTSRLPITNLVSMSASAILHQVKANRLLKWIEYKLYKPLKQLMNTQVIYSCRNAWIGSIFAARRAGM